MKVLEFRWWRQICERGKHAGRRSAAEGLLSPSTVRTDPADERQNLEALQAELARLDRRCAELETECATGRSERDVYKHSFETTTIDRDRLKEILASAADTLDAGFFQFDLASVDCQFDALKKMFGSGDYCAMMASFVGNARVGIALPNGPGYFRPLAAYYLACLHIVRGEQECASKYIELLDFHALPDGDNFLPYDIRQGTRLGWYRQELAIQAGKPGALITSLPKSASSFLSRTIAREFDLPILRVSLGDRIRAVVSEKWVRQVVRGGAVTHEHFPANAINLDALRRGGLRTLYVQIRDPRDAVYSIQMMASGFDAGTFPHLRRPGDTSEAWFADMNCLYSNWIDQWISAAETSSSGLDVQFLTFDDVTQKTAETLTQMFPGHSFSKAASEVSSNFRNGTGGEWRDAFSAKTHASIWSAIPDRVKDLLSLER